MNLRRAGVTLLELIVVIVVLVALAAIVVPMFSGVNTEAQYTTTKASMVALRKAIIAYNQDMKLPAAWSSTATSLATTGVPLTLKDLVLRPAGSLPYSPITGAGWRGPYLMQATGSFLDQTTPTKVGLDPSFYPTSGMTYGAEKDPAFLDAWGNPIVLQWPQAQSGDSAAIYSQYVRLVSAGPPTSVMIGGQSASQAIIVTPSNTAGNLAPNQYIPTTAQRSNEPFVHNMVMFIFVQDPYPWSPTN